MKSEFANCVKLFAPSCVLEELKVRVLLAHKSVEAAFRNIKDRRSPLKREAFHSLLQSLGVNCDNEDQIFDFLDIRSTGVTTVSEIVAALQCLQCGVRKLPAHSESKSILESTVQ